MNCSHKILHSLENSHLACDYLKTCNYQADYFDLLTFNYCIVENRQYITWPLIVLIFILCFYFLSSTVDQYVSRILGRMSVKLNISQNLAGLTLLAFGNQVVDIIVALVSSDEDNGGIEASLSTILGADSLVIGFVMPTVIFLGNGVIVKGQNFLRDLVTYLIGLSFVIFLGTVRKELNIIYGAIIFSLYIVYVGICILMEKVENIKRLKKEEEERKRKKEIEDYSEDYDENESIEQDDEKHDFVITLLDTEDNKYKLYDESKSSIFLEKKSTKEENDFEKKHIKINVPDNDHKKDIEKSEKENKEENKNEKEKIDSNDKKEVDENIDIEQTKEKNDIKEKKENNEEEELEENEDNNNSEKDNNDECEHDIIGSLSDKKSLIEDVASLKGPKGFNIKNFLNDQYYAEKSRESIKLHKFHRQTSIDIKEKNLVYNRLHYILAKYYLNNKEEKWKDTSCFKKIIKIMVEIPLNLIRDLTTPPFEKEKWKKEFLALSPVFISLSISLFFKLFKYYVLYPHYIFIISYYALLVILGIFLYKKTYRGSLPNCEWILLVSAFAMSLIWIYVITTILIQMVNDSKMLFPFEVSRSFLIMTILAVGNALPDFLVDVTLSKRGYAEMALSGAIGSPVFSLLFGFGLSLIKTFAFSNKKAEEFNLLSFTPSNKVILCAMLGIFANLIYYMIVFACVGFRAKKYVSFAGFFIFTEYLIAIVLVSFVFT